MSEQAQVQQHIRTRFGVSNAEAYASRRIRQTRMQTDAPMSHPASLRWASNTYISGWFKAKAKAAAPHLESAARAAAPHVSAAARQVLSGKVMPQLVY